MELRHTLCSGRSLQAFRSPIIFACEYPTILRLELMVSWTHSGHQTARSSYGFAHIEDASGRTTGFSREDAMLKLWVSLAGKPYPQKRPWQSYFPISTRRSLFIDTQFTVDRFAVLCAKNRCAVDVDRQSDPIRETVNPAMHWLTGSS